jgi:hypothetical protein
MGLNIMKIIYGHNYAALTGRSGLFDGINPERCSGLIHVALSGR